MAKNSFGWDNWTGTGVNDADSLAAEIDRIKKWMRTHSGIDFSAAGPDYPHPSQRVRTLIFFEGQGRLDPTGIQIADDLTQQSAVRGLFWLPEFSDTPGDVYPQAKVTGDLWNVGNDNARMIMSAASASGEYAEVIVMDSEASVERSIRMNVSTFTNTFASLFIESDTDEPLAGVTNTAFQFGTTSSDYAFNLADGQIWYRSDLDKFRARANGVTENLAFESSIPTTMNKQPFAAKTTTYVTTANDGVISVDASSASFTVTLVTAVGNSGLTQTFKKINAANVVTIDASSTQTIDGALTYALSAQWSWVTLVSTGSAWIITGQG